MAESYRGLTIRIGADTSTLSKSLKQANGAISNTNQELRKLGQALRLDPSNIEAYKLQMGYMSQQAANTAMKLAALKHAAEQIGGDKIELSDGTSSTVEDMSNAAKKFGTEIGNVSGKLAVAQTSLAKTTSVLATMHNEMTDITSAAAKVERMKLGAALDLATGIGDETKIKEMFAQLDDGYERADSDIDAIMKSVREMSKEFEGAFDLKDGKFEASIAKIKKAIKEIYAGDGFKIDSDGLTEMATKIESVMKSYSQQYDELLSKEKSLREEYDSGMDSLKSDVLKKENDAYDEQVAKIREGAKSQEELVSKIEAARAAQQKLNEEVAETETRIDETWKNMSSGEQASLFEGEGTGDQKAYNDATEATLGKVRELAAANRDVAALERQKAELAMQFADDEGAAKAVLEEAYNTELSHIEAARKSGDESVASAEDEAKMRKRASELAKENADWEKSVAKEMKAESEAIKEIVKARDENKEKMKAERDEMQAQIDALKEAKSLVSKGEDASGVKGLPEGADLSSVKAIQAQMDELAKKSKENFSQQRAASRAYNDEIKKIISSEIALRKEKARQVIDFAKKEEEAERQHQDAMKDIGNGREGVHTSYFALTDDAEVKAAYEGLKNVKAEAEATKEQIEELTQSIIAGMGRFGSGFEGLAGEIFNNKAGDTNADHIQDVLDRITSTLGLSRSETVAFSEEVRRLAEEFKNANGDVQQLEKVLKFDDLMVEVTKTEAGIASLAQAMRDMHAPSDVMRGMYELNANVEELQQAYSALMNTGRSLSSMLAVDPSGIEVVTQAMAAFSAAETVAVENANRMHQRLESFDAEKIREISDPMKSATQQLFDAANAAQKTQEEYDTLTGTLQLFEAAKKQAEDAQGETVDPKRLGVDEDSIKNMEEFKTLVNEASEDAGKFTQKIDETRASVSKARQANEEAIKTLENAKMRKEYEEAAAGAAEWAAKVHEARQAQIDFAKTGAVSFAFGDMSEIDELGTQLDVVVNKAQSLQTVLRADPTNADAAAARMKALADAESIAATQAEKIRAKLAALDTSRVDQLKEKFKTSGEAVAATTAQANNLSQGIEKARQKLAQMVEGEKFDELRDDIMNTSKEIGVDLPADVQEARNALINLVNQFKAALGDVSDASVWAFIDYVEAAANEAAAKVKGINMQPELDDAAFQQAAQRMAQIAEQAAQKIVESANTIDAAYRDMRKTVNGTEEEFEQLQQSAIKFSQTNAVSADTILSVEALGGQLGIAAESLQNFGENISAVEIATDMTADDLALKFGQMSNVMSDLDGKDFQPLADALVRLGNNTATTESAIMDVAQRISAVANVTSMSTPQVLAWAAAISSTGMHSESAATSIVKTITGIGDAVAKGGDTLTQFAAIANMTADDFSDKWRNSSSEALEAFVKGLAELTDDSTDAIAALDSVGISSVRQETSLLALSQTVDKVSDSVEMSTNAFNGVSDQWGQAGDAAREAHNKSEGFSGALSIMQNNLTNLAAAMGDGLVGPMQTISKVLTVLTDAINGMPGPLKSTIVTWGGLAAVLGTVYPAIKQFKQGWAEMLSTMTNTPSISNKVKQAIIEAGNALVTMMGELKLMPSAMASVIANGQGLTGVLSVLRAGAYTAAEGFTALMTAAWPLLAISAVVAVLSEAVTVFNEFKEISDLTADTSKSLSSALEDMDAKIGKVSESMKSTGIESLNESLTSAKDGLNGLKTAAEGVSETMDETAANVATVKAYADEMQELSSKSSLTAGEQERLAQAVKSYNEVTGSSIEVINAQTGELSLNEEQIRRVTEAYEEQVTKQAYLEAYEDLIKAQARAQVELESATEKSTDALNGENNAYLQFAEAMSRNDLKGAFDIAKTAIEGQQAIDGLKTETEDAGRQAEIAKKHYDELAGNTTQWSSFEEAMVSAGYATSELTDLTGEQRSKLLEVENALLKAGTSLKNWEGLNASSLASIAAAWRGSASEIIAYINQIASSSSSAGKSSTPSDDQVRDFKNQQEAAYTAAKRANEDYYNSVKAARDADYNNLKKQLDAEYNAVKKSLDKQYNARKDQLDAEYNAAKKASDKYLKEYKAALDKQVEDHKSATDKRLKDLEREYEKKKELLELDYTKKDDEISAKIQAIKDEQEAEDEAREQAERAEKLAEYGREAESAKTAKKRAEAEKKLADYKAELAREDTKKQRDAQIKVLEDQQDALDKLREQREKHLKDTYDTAVEKYKAQREAELKILQETNEAKYESQKELETARLEAIKKSHEAELEMLKESNDAQLESIKNANDSYLEGVKARNDAELNEIKRANEDALTELKNRQERELAAFKEGGQAAVDALYETKKAAEEASDATKNAASQMEQSVTGSFKRMANALNQHKDIDLPTYLTAINGLPSSIEEVFNRAGLTVENGLGEVAKIMLERGQISLYQYTNIMSGMPGATRAICNQTGVAIAEELGLFNESSSAAAANLKNSVVGQFGPMPEEVKGKSDEAGNAAASLGGQEAVDNAAKNSGNLYEAVRSQWVNVGTDGENAGAQYPLGVASGVNKNADKPVKAASSMSESVQKGMDVSGSTPALAQNAVVGWNNSFVDWGNRALQNVSEWARNVLNTITGIHLINSPSRKFAWLAEMAMRGYLNGWESSSGYVDDAVADTARGVMSAFSGVSLNADFTQDLIDGMRAREDELRRQSERMAQIVEEGFNPRLYLDSAYEAMDRIDAGELRRQQTIAASSTQNNDNRQISITVSIPEVVVREEADIDRLSSQIALRVQRQLNARIG